MLVLSRKIGQSIRINDNVSILVVDVDGRNVKLGIDAPKSVGVHREEVYQRIQLDKDAAPESSPTEADSQTQKVEKTAEAV